MLWNKGSSVCNQHTCVFCLACLHDSCLFFPSGCLNTPEISIGLPRTGICEGTELPPRTVSPRTSLSPETLINMAKCLKSGALCWWDF